MDGRAPPAQECALARCRAILSALGPCCRAHRRFRWADRLAYAWPFSHLRSLGAGPHNRRSGGGPAERRWNTPARSLAALCAAALVLGGPPRAGAETDISNPPRWAGGVGFLPLLIMEQQGLIERQAREAGIANLKAEWIKLGGPASSTISCCRAQPTSWPPAHRPF